jgi:hypothetical protein
MMVSGFLLKMALIIALAVVVMYLLNCFNKPSLEHFENPYCEAALTAPGTTVYITSARNNKYLSVNKQKVNDNLELQTLVSQSPSWSLQQIVQENCVASQNNNDASCCSVQIQTDDEEFHITYNKNGNPEKVGASHVSDTNYQKWYVLKFSQRGMPNLYQAISKMYQSKNMKMRYNLYLIATSPKDFSGNPSDPPARYLTISQNNQSPLPGNFYLADNPSIDSIWEISIKKNGKITPLPPFRPIEALGAFPNQNPKNRNKKGTYKSEYGAFMPSFLPIWNRTFWSPGNYSPVKKNNYLRQITVQLDDIYENRRSGQATGYIYLSTVPIDQVNFSKPVFSTKHSQVIPVKSYGDDMLYGTTTIKDKTYTIILKMLPGNVQELGTPKNIPLLQGWFVTKEKNKQNQEVASTIPLCAPACDNDDLSCAQENMMGVCESLLPGMKFEQFMLKNGFVSIDSKNNFNLSNQLTQAVHFEKPPPNWVKYVNQKHLNDFSYGKEGQVPYGKENILATLQSSSINDCLNYCGSGKEVNEQNIHMYDSLGNKITPKEVSEYCDRISYVVPNVSVNKDGMSLDESKKGTCTLAAGGQWNMDSTENIVGVIRKQPRTTLFDKKFESIGGKGTTLQTTSDLEPTEPAEPFENPMFRDEKEHFEQVVNINECAKLCENNLACREFSFDPMTGECHLATEGTTKTTNQSKEDWDVSYNYIGGRNILQGAENKFFNEFPAGTSFLNDPMEVLGNAQGTVVGDINKCADLCKNQPNCDRFSFDAQTRTCYPQSMGKQSYSGDSTFYAATKNNFVPQANDNTKKTFIIYPASVYSGGTPVPFGTMKQINNIATVDECAKECSANEWCDTFSYDAKEKTCNQFMASQTPVTSGNPQQIVGKKKPSPTGSLQLKSNLNSFDQTQPASTIQGGAILETNPAKNADDCASQCTNKNYDCDMFIYDDDKKTCALYNSGDCSNPQSDLCGKIISPAQTPFSYTSKMKLSASGAADGNLYNTKKNTGDCNCISYCAKDWNNELSDQGWESGICYRSYAEYENGDTVEVSCWDRPPETSNGSKLKNHACQCRKNDQPASFKEPPSSVLYKKDCNIAPNQRILLGGVTKEDIKQGICDCNSYMSSKKYGGKELEEKGAGNWKGVTLYRAGSIQTDNPINDTIFHQIPGNQATSPTGNGPGIACWVTQDDNGSFSNTSDSCTSSQTDYKCNIL